MHIGEREKRIALVVLVICFIIGWFWWLSCSWNFTSGFDQDEKTSGDYSVIDGEAGSGQLIFVHIAGEVVSPGVYQVASGTRYFQLVEKAGGLTEGADVATINLAQSLVDGEKYVVPSLNGMQPEEIGGKNELSGIVNINTADSSKLDTLPGIGPATAEKIIRFREQHGNFVSSEDIMSVPGIGASKFEDIKHLITTK